MAVVYVTLKKGPADESQKLAYVLLICFDAMVAIVNATRSYLSLILFALALILAVLVMIVVVSIPVVGKGSGATPRNRTGVACPI